MKKLQFLLLGLLGIVHINYSQESICADLTDEVSWPEAVYMYDDIIGDWDGDDLSFSVSDPGIGDGGIGLNAYEPGLYGWNAQVDFEFSGENQLVNYTVYGWLESSEWGFSINGSAMIPINSVFPMTVDGVVIDLDESAPDFDSWDVSYLRFEGEIDDIGIILFESGITFLCATDIPDEPLAEGCEDFTLDTWGEATYESGDIAGTWGEDDLSISISDPGLGGVWAGLNAFEPGFYGVDAQVDFEMTGDNQSISIEVFGWFVSDEWGFTINGSPFYPINSSFPMTVDGVVIDLDDSAPGFDSWDAAYLIFEGEIDEIGIVLFESGITGICKTDLRDVMPEGCEDFTLDTWEEATFEAGDIAGTWSEDDLSISINDAGLGDLWCGLNSDVRGFYGGDVEVGFEMTGENQIVSVEVYGWMDADDWGFTINGSPFYPINSSFPMTVDGVVIDLDDSAPGFDSWDAAYLTFEGEIDNIGIVLFESGITSICRTILPVEPEPMMCEDFTLDAWAPSMLENGVVGTWGEDDLSITLSDEIDDIAPYVGINQMSQPGFYGSNGVLSFAMSGESQIATFEIYAMEAQLAYMGFAINGGSFTYLDGAFPMTIEGVTIDLDESATDFDMYNGYYLTFEGELSEISLSLFESGIKSICSEESGELGIKNEVINRLEVYPNPSHDIVNINADQSIQSIQVYNMAGALILSKTIGETNQSILNVSELEQGVYLIKTKFNNESEALSKFMKN
ncbi:T9SS type A sorting domain-containing protein [Crocinitomix catalasitica]|uniref:T9SS type A sorting domain-containing protein n=1 Tax=Crocinitomix catalasitica TaxID=184607 RepID=UPI0004882305|nr:T9SS type A sorting domain-containing protein [Crocinitomix catalasitica]